MSNKTGKLSFFLDKVQGKPTKTQAKKATPLGDTKEEVERKHQELIGDINSSNVEVVKSDDESAQIKARSLDQVLKKCGIDKNAWGVDDFNLKELSSGEFLWTVYFNKKKDSFNPEELLQSIRKISPEVSIGKNVASYDSLLAEVNIPDLHIGKLSWKEEVGHNYDIKIAKQIFRDAIDFKIKELSKFKVEKILFPVGNDFLHYDNAEGTTTAGTKQDCDTRYLKMFREGTALLIETINKLQQIAPVDCLIVAGNHARISELLLGELLEAYYHNNDRVFIEKSPVPRKYYQYGNSLIGFAHGDNVKFNDLPIIMAAEAPEIWGKSKYKYFKMGHLHHQRIMLNEIGSVIVEIISSLSGVDYWHKTKAFSSSTRSCTTSLYDKKMGCIHKIYYNL